MLLEKAGVHGLHALCHLSRQPADMRVSSTAISEAAGVPPEHARKILMGLCTAGLVNSTRGRSGGYALAKKLEDISVLEVSDALGPRTEAGGHKPRACPVYAGESCRVQSGLTVLRDQVRAIYAGTTVASLAGAVCGQRTGTDKCNNDRRCIELSQDLVVAL